MLISTALAQTGGAGPGSGLEMFLPFILILVVFYFLLWRPQQKKMKQHRAMLGNLKRGDRVVTGGGIIGRVAKVDGDSELIVEIASGVRVRVIRSTVTDVMSRGEPAGKSDDKAPAKTKSGGKDDGKAPAKAKGDGKDDGKAPAKGDGKAPAKGDGKDDGKEKAAS